MEFTSERSGECLDKFLASRLRKPAGLLTHPTLNQPRHILVNALVAKYPEIAKVGENPLRPGIVHRLDKDTSGLLVIAKNQNAFLFLKEQFLQRQVIKKYLALVEEVPKEKEGMIEYAIRPSKAFRLKKSSRHTSDDRYKYDKRRRNEGRNEKIYKKRLN